MCDYDSAKATFQDVCYAYYPSMPATIFKDNRHNKSQQHLKVGNHSAISSALGSLLNT